MSTSDEPIWTKNFFGISFVHFIVFVIFYTLLTTLPLYVVNDLKGTEAQGGLIVTAMLVAAILIRPFSGKLLGRAGKRKVLISTVFIFTVTTFGYIWVDQFSVLIILRFIHGLSFGVVTTATAAIAVDVLPQKRQGEGLGYFTMAMNLAVVAGPFIGLTLIQFITFQQLFSVLSIFMIIGVLCTLLVKVTETEKPKKALEKRKLSLDDFFEFRAIPISLISSLVAFAYAGIVSFISVYAANIGLGDMSNYFFLVFAVTMLLFRPFLGRLFDQRGPKIVILPCLVTFAVGLVVLSLAESGFLFLLAAALIGVGYGTILPCVLSLSVQYAPRERNGHATATFFMLYDTGIAAGSYILGIIVSITGFSLMFSCSAILVVLTAAGFYYLLNHTEGAKKRNLKLEKSS
ncbi:MFS transporter [Alteribacillus sp. JSM 102045]|uniref:MFS transporter n=1 Tax=Alteribacillus sp. JSM 102045 TaxID=1562101 RepID=UPI0035C0555D